MGNKLCMSDDSKRSEDIYEDLSDADFDFIAVQIANDPSKQKKQEPLVSVIPVDVVEPQELVVQSRVPLLTPCNSQEDKLSFNERLSMIQWDPELPIPKYAKRQEMYVFDEFEVRQLNGPKIKETIVEKKPKKVSWFAKAFKRFTKEKSVSKKTAVKEIQEKESIEHSSIFSDTESENSCVLDVDEAGSIHSVSPDPDASATHAGGLRQRIRMILMMQRFAALGHQVMEERLTKIIQYSLTQQDSWGPLDEDHMIEVDTSAYGIHLDDYLCKCGECPLYKMIEQEVTNSNCWMNEQERQSICRILQAYSTYNESSIFKRQMIDSAEECLLVFHNDEHAAFNALVTLLDAKKQ
jgi:hypothetical protein